MRLRNRNTPSGIKKVNKNKMKKKPAKIVANLMAITDTLVDRLKTLSFAAPVTHTYNPLSYAREGYDCYIQRFGCKSTPIVLVGMNPGPFGMAQTGVPFGDVTMVKAWLGIEACVHQPDHPHPKRPINGFACPRGEVSGQRLWGWARSRFGHPDAFFRQFFVLNYCPLVFMEASGRNRTPDKLPVAERKPLFSICDDALRQAVKTIGPTTVVGIGTFAEKRTTSALEGIPVSIGRISHPSPANPKANRGWDRLVETELEAMGIDLLHQP